MFLKQTALLSLLLYLNTSPTLATEPAQLVPFKQAGILNAWDKYRDILSFGKNQTLALLDDGCDLSKPEWSNDANGDYPKILVTYDSVDGDSNPKHEGRGYHGTTIGIPSSVNHGGKRGVAFNNQLAIVRSLECCHCELSDSKTLAAALKWVVDNHKQYRITTVNLAPVDDLAHKAPVMTEIDDQLKRLRRIGIWVSAPTGNHNFTTGISWPASQPNCFAIGAVKPGTDKVFLDRHRKVDLVVPAHATSSSNAILCGAAMILREAITTAEYNWTTWGNNLPEAMMAIFQRTGTTLKDPDTGLSFKMLSLTAAIDLVFGT